MASSECVDHMGSDLNGETAKFSHSEDKERSQNSQEALETAVSSSEIESERQSTTVGVVSGGSEQISMDVVSENGRAIPGPSQEENGSEDATTSEETGPGAFLSFESHENSSSFVVSLDKETATADSDDFHPELNHGDTAAQERDEDSYGANSTGASPVADGKSALKRQDSWERFCFELMDEREKTARLLKKKDDDVVRLRKLAFDTEKDKMGLKNQLAQVLTRIVLAEKETDDAKEENARLRAEIVKLTKRIEEVEVENKDFKCQLEKARGGHGYLGENKTLENEESVKLCRVDELEENVDPEIPSVVGQDGDSQRDEAKKAETESTDENGESDDVVRRKERAAKRTSPNFYRHSFAGSLPRPFHSYELPRQSSREHRRERADSPHSDASSDSADSERGSHSPSPSIPFFPKGADKTTIRKSGFSPVQFNYRPLPESIMTHRRESWDAVRHGSMVRERGYDYKSRSFSSDSGFGEIDGGARTNEAVESLSREPHADDLSSAQDNACFDGGDEKLAGEIETEKDGVTPEASSLHPENTQNFKDLISEPTVSTREIHTNVPLQVGDDGDFSNDRSQEPEEKKTEKVSDLVNIWNSRTTEVFNV